MKDKLRHSESWFAFLLAGTVISAVAQNYSMDWRVVAGGGGSSTGGTYQVTGTLGEPIAGAMSGGAYDVTGGFWAILSVVQTPGAPTLRIVLTSTNTVILSWPVGPANFALQQNGDLRSTNWVNVGQAPVVVGDQNEVIVSAPVGERFYRLKWP